MTSRLNDESTVAIVSVLVGAVVIRLIRKVA